MEKVEQAWTHTMPLSLSYLYKHAIRPAVHVRIGTASNRERAARPMSK